MADLAPCFLPASSARVSVGTLNAKGSLFLTRLGLAAHASDIDEYRLRAEAVLSAVAIGTILPDVTNVSALAQAAAAHAAIEGRKSQGAILLKP